MENAVAGADGSQFATILSALVAPRSKGSVTIASPDTAVLPVIDPGWLTDPVDQAVAIEGFKRVRAAFQARAMQPILVGPEYTPGNATQTDAQILAFVRANLMTVWHASCTCAMRRREYGGVLDSSLRVYDVSGLRVVDASSFPQLPPGRTCGLPAFRSMFVLVLMPYLDPQSTVYMLAEKAAALIKASS